MNALSAPIWNRFLFVPEGPTATGGELSRSLCKQSHVGPFWPAWLWDFPIGNKSLSPSQAAGGILENWGVNAKAGQHSLHDEYASWKSVVLREGERQGGGEERERRACREQGCHMSPVALTCAARGKLLNVSRNLDGSFHHKSLNIHCLLVPLLLPSSPPASCSYETNEDSSTSNSNTLLEQQAEDIGLSVTIYFWCLSPQSCPCNGLSSFPSLGKDLTAVCWWKCETSCVFSWPSGATSLMLWQIHSLDSLFLCVRFYSCLFFFFWYSCPTEVNLKMSFILRWMFSLKSLWGFQMMSSHSQHIDVCKRTSRFL